MTHDLPKTGPFLPKFLIAPANWILKKLHRLLGVDIRFFAKNATIVTLSYGISILRGIVTGYLVARLFPRELYGQYQFILSVVGVLGILSLPNVSTALSRAVARGETGVVMPVARIQFLLSLVGSAALLIMIPFLPTERAALWPLFVLAALLLPVSQTAGSMFLSVTVGKARFGKALYANLIWSTAMVLATLLILFLHPSAALLFCMGTGLPALTYLWFSRPLIQHVSPPPSVRHILRYGIQLTLASLPLTLSWYLDKLLISSLMGLNQLAVFSVAILLPEQIKTWAKELLPVSFAVQARGNDSRERRMRLLRAVGRSTLLFLLGIVGYVLLAPLIFTIFFPNYPEAVFLSQVAALMLITVPSSLFTQYLEAQAMLPALRATRWFAAAVYCLSLIILIPAYGLLGAVLARGMLRIAYSLSALYCLLWIPPSPASHESVPANTK